MNACLITIGDEILIGQVVNTNASYLSQKLFSAGIKAERIVSVGDDEKNILDELKNAEKNFDIVLVTGGLGPTHDDITKQCIVKFFKTILVFDKNVYRSVESRFSSRQIKIPPKNIFQAFIPKIAKPLFNAHGTAPGLLICRNKTAFCFMPGVPYEMKYITEKHLLPFLRKNFKTKNVLLQKTLHTFGIPESLLAEKLGNINNIIGRKKYGSVKLAFLPSSAGVRMRVNVDATNKKNGVNLLNEAVNKINFKAGKFIYSSDEEELTKVVGSLLKKKNKTIAVAESCTGGLISSMITDVPGSSDYFSEGVVAYSNDAKKKLLGVKENTLKKFGAVSEQTAEQMADGVRRVSKSDIGVSTTGIAGPTGATKSKPVGLVWIGYSDNKVTLAKKFIFTKDRLRNKELAAKWALEIVRKRLLAIE